ncbi:hypothetical protein [Sinomonas atrocyanea]
MAGSTAVEAERKYDVGPDRDVPDLASLPGVLRAGPLPWNGSRRCTSTPPIWRWQRMG